MNENLSWNRGSDTDPIHGYMKRLGINKEDMIEAEVAPVRQYIVPILKEFDKFENGKISKETFEKNTSIMQFANADNKSGCAQNKIFDEFEASNKNKKDSIEEKMSIIDSRILDYNAKLTINPNDDSSKSKLENMELKKNIEQDKLEMIVSSANLVKRDQKMLNKFAKAYAKAKENGETLNLKSPQNAELNQWKQEILQRYAA